MWQLPQATNKWLAWLLSLAAALFLSLFIFWLMAQLLQQPKHNKLKSLAPMDINIERVKAAKKTKNKQKEAPKEKPQPNMQSLQPTPPTPSAAPPKLSNEGLAINAPQLDMKEFTIEQQHWSAPVSSENGSGSDANYIGEEDTGKKPFTPSATRRPNIPKVAYDNKINGWVLLAYTVDNRGKIDNIRVLDAEPRGIFEANAIAAVKRWVYPSFKGEVKHLSQRIEFEWNMYSYNMDYY